MRKRLTDFLWTLLAAVFLVEAWLWDILGATVGRLVALLPIERLRHVLRGLIDRLPAVFALALFLVPVLVILPFKLAGLALIAKGRVIAGGAVFLAAKSAGLGVTAFIFDVCHDRLLTLGWFAALYRRVIAFKDWAHARIAPYRARIVAWRARLADRIGSRDSSLFRRFAAVRARAHERRRSA